MWFSDRKKEKWQRDIFSSAAADSLHTFFWKERCSLTVTSLVSLPKTDTHPLDSHSRCSVLYSVLTSTYMFYWLKRGLIPVRQNCPNLYQQFGFRKSLTQHPVGLSLLLYWLEKGVRSQATVNQATQGAHRSNTALQIAPRRKEHRTLRNRCGMFSV